MKNKRILITGGAGLIGSHIADLVAAEAAEVVVLDNFVRGRRENLAAGDAERPRHDCRGRPARPRVWSTRSWTASTSSSIRRRSASPSAPRSRGWPSTCWSTARSTSSRPRSQRVSKVVAASSASVYGLAEAFPTDRKSPSVREPHDLRRGEGVQRRHAAQLQRHVRAEVRRACATSMSTARAWMCTAPTPRSSSAGWNGSPPARRL